MDQVLEEIASKRARRHYSSYEQREARARAEQQEIAKGNQRTRSVKGLGQLQYEIPASVAKEWMHQEHKDVLRDPDFIKYQKRKNPDLFARHEKAENRVGYGD